MKRLFQWTKLFNMFYIEPLIVAVAFSQFLSATILKHQIIYQTCKTIYNYNESVCELLGTKNANDYSNQIETEVQPYVANMLMVRSVAESIVPTICGLFIGSWSDYYGRKPLLLISMIGYSLTYIIAAVICQISGYVAVNPWYYIISAMPHSLLGGTHVLTVAAICYISDVTNYKTRPFRYLFMDTAMYFAMTSGSFLSSFIYNATNATSVLSISSTLLVIGTVYTFIWVPESIHLKKKCDDIEEETEKEAIESNDNHHKNSSVIKYPNEIPTKFEPETYEKQENREKPERMSPHSLGHIKDVFSTCFRRRLYYDRSIIWLSTGTLFIYMFVFDGSATVAYLYTREKFHWTVRDFTVYETVYTAVPVIGAFFGFLVLRKLFGVSILLLSLLSITSDFVGYLVRGLATQSWHLYLSVGLSIFRTLYSPMCRAIVSNIAPPNDLGKIFSIKNVLQSFSLFVAAPVYTLIYQSSITTYPGLFFIFSDLCLAIAFAFIIIIVVFKYKCRSHYAQSLK